MKFEFEKYTQLSYEDGNVELVAKADSFGVWFRFYLEGNDFNATGTIGLNKQDSRQLAENILEWLDKDSKGIDDRNKLALDPSKGRWRTENE